MSAGRSARTAGNAPSTTCPPARETSEVRLLYWDTSERRDDQPPPLRTGQLVRIITCKHGLPQHPVKMGRYKWRPNYSGHKSYVDMEIGTAKVVEVIETTSCEAALQARGRGLERYILCPNGRQCARPRHASRRTCRPRGRCEGK
jgi:hypothetical protein